MESQVQTTPPAVPPAGARWWENPGEIRHRVAGVFEGGGAKGVAYAGALQAVRDRHIWFEAVAGSSAGAITAALVAAGLTPKDVEGQTVQALDSARTRLWPGLRRLRRLTGYFPKPRLHAWLEDVLARQVERLTGAPVTGPVTFSHLYQASGIELNVVAADLTLRRQIVFNDEYTPNCQVADAVVASAAIPFGFASSDLKLHGADGDGRPWVHTLVDGGVWSNFPMFVFTDAAFRRWRSKGRLHAHLSARPAPKYTLGFLLTEAKTDPNDPGRFHDARFLEPGDSKPRPAEERVTGRSAHPAGRGRAARAWRLLLKAAVAALALLTVPLLTLANAVGLRGIPARWTTPRHRILRQLLEFVDATLRILYRPVIGLLVWCVLALGAFGVLREVFRWAANLAPDQAAGIGIEPANLLLANVLLGVTVAAVLLLALLGAAANVLLLNAFRRIGFGLVRTYVAAPGAPPWSDEGDPHKETVIGLPIPPTVGILSFDLDDATRRRLVRKAYDVTRQKLRGIRLR